MGTRQEWGLMEGLLAVGEQLDADAVVNVLNGGIVVPNTTGVFFQNSGKEFTNVTTKRTGRPATGPRQRTPGWQGPSGGARSSSAATPVVGEAVQRRYEAELNDLDRYYPGTRLWQQDLGVWLLTRSTVIEGIGRQALFLTGVSYAWPAVKSWGFWAHPMSAPTWIGPRHTNFNDGSICSFELSDQTWTYGQPLVRLLDLHTVWALRHLHHELVGRWPGRQVAHYTIERLVELRDDELCGCGGTAKYNVCCKPYDEAANQIADAVQYALRPRHPPAGVLAAVRCGGVPPPVTNLV